MSLHETPIGLTPTERSVRARMGAYALHSQHDPRVTTQAARAAFLQHFEEKVDPDHILPPEERARRGRAAHRAHMLRLALKSVLARRRRREAG